MKKNKQMKLLICDTFLSVILHSRDKQDGKLVRKESVFLHHLIATRFFLKNYTRQPKLIIYIDI